MKAAGFSDDNTILSYIYFKFIILIPCFIKEFSTITTPSLGRATGILKRSYLLLQHSASGLRLETDDAGGIDPHKPVVMNT